MSRQPFSHPQKPHSLPEGPGSPPVGRPRAAVCGVCGAGGCTRGRSSGGGDEESSASRDRRRGRDGTGEVIGEAIDAFERELNGKRRPGTNFVDVATMT